MQARQNVFRRWSRGGALRSSGALYIKLSSDEHILYFICDTDRSRICVGSRGGAPESQGFWTINYCQMSIFWYLFCDTGRTQIGVGSRGRRRRKLRGFVQSITVRWAYYYTLFVTLAGHKLMFVPGGGAGPRSSGFLGIKFPSDDVQVPDFGA